MPDSFDGVGLGAQWSVIDPVGDGTVSVPGTGVAELSVPAGTAHDAWGTNGALRISQPLVDQGSLITQSEGAG